MTVILASTSAIRRTLLEKAGIVFAVRPPLTDEMQLKKMLDPAKPEDIATALAEAKACSISRQGAPELVVGADQVLALAGTIFDKPRDLAEARAQLSALRDKTHELHSALACACGGKIIWRHMETARLTMRSFSDTYLENYIARLGNEATRSVGGYKLEGEGIQLFEKIEGDYFAILGLPLLPLLIFLRERGELAS